MVQLNRRDILKTGVVLGAGLMNGTSMALAEQLQSRQVQRSAADWVTLGKSDVRVTRLAFGTGSRGGKVQRDLGQRDFTRLVHS